MSGKNYQIDFSAADPVLYSRLLFDQIDTLPSGRDSDPLSGAADSTSVESLAPEYLALGQIVPFEFRISVDNAGTVNGDTITVTAGWETVTTNGGLFGYDGNLGVIAAFVDSSDPSASGDTDATVSDFSWTLVGTEIQGTFDITNLDPGEEIVLEAWLVLQDEIPEGTAGNVQSRLISAETSGTTEAGDTISTGNQTIPLLRVKEFFTTQADLSVVTSDSDIITAGDDSAQVNVGEQFTYTIVATNNSDAVANQVLVTDNLDPNVKFISAEVIDSEGTITTVSHDGSTSGGTLTGDLGFLNPREEVTIEVTVEVLETAPTDGIDDLSNTITITSITDDPNTSNNTDTELTDVINNSVAIDNSNNTSGVFKVGETGTISFDYLYDGGWFQGELAVFSLQGMESYEAGSQEFMVEAARRALTNSQEGRILLQDRQQGAKFSEDLAWENNFNAGEYQGVKTFDMTAGDELAFMLVQHTTVQDIYQNPNNISKWGKLPIFSIPEANPFGTAPNQVVAVDNNGTLAFEDVRIDQGKSDQDYNDVVVQVRGLEGNVATMDENVNPNRDWRTTETGQALLEYADRPIFSEGVFEVGETGEITFDFLFDGGWFQGELAVFNLQGMGNYEVGSQAFIQEAANRALSNSDLGYILAQDKIEGARFSKNLAWERNFNAGEYQGIKTFAMNPGDEFALMLIQHTSVQEIADDPSKVGQWGKRALFSIPEANPGGESQGQIVDINGNGAFAMEDLALNGNFSDRDYNDMVFQIKGADATVASIEQFSNPDRDWLTTTIGEELLEYANRAVFDEGVFQVGASGEVIIDFLYDGGWYTGAEVGIFSLAGMDMYETGSEAFIQEAIDRATSNTNQGYVVVQDTNEGAKFSDDPLWEGNYNNGEYQGRQTFLMNPGDTFGLVLVPDGTLDEALSAPDWAVKKDPLFSMSAANLDDQIQFADIFTGAEGTIVGFEDVRLDLDSNTDYNDAVLAIEGVQRIGLTDIEDVISTNRNWLDTEVGQEIIGYFDSELI